MPSRPNRREFLSVAGAAALASGIPARAGTPWRPRNPRERVRLAVAGGGFGASHHWHEHPNCDVVAVTDLVEERRQALVRNYACPNAFESLEEIGVPPSIQDGGTHIVTFPFIFEVVPR